MTLERGLVIPQHHELADDKKTDRVSTHGIRRNPVAAGDLQQPRLVPAGALADFIGDDEARAAQWHELGAVGLDWALHQGLGGQLYRVVAHDAEERVGEDILAVSPGSM